MLPTNSSAAIGEVPTRAWQEHFPDALAGPGLHTSHDSTIPPPDAESDSSAAPVTVGRLLHLIHPFGCNATCDAVLAAFLADNALHSLPIVDDAEQPIALVTRREYVEFFSKPYARDIFGRRTIQHLLAHPIYKSQRPIVIESNCSIDDAAKTIIDAGVSHMVTGIIVTDGGRYAGISNGYDMLNTIRVRERESEFRLVREKRIAEEASIAKSQFLANMSHEIRTPMNGVLGMTELLMDAGLNETQRRYAQIIRTSGESLLRIINDILDFSKIEAGRLELDPIDVDLRDITEELMQLLASQAHEKGIELTCHVKPEVPHCIRADQVRLRQILLNLVTNALKFTEKGEVRVVVERMDNDAGDDPLSLCRVRFRVIDTGIGISEDAKSRLFRSFSQLDASTTRRFGGTGLGLAVSKQLATMMGGDIGVESRPAKGSEFWFTISAEIIDAHPTVQPSADLTGVRILVVDDNASNREILRHQIHALGGSCSLAEDGVEGLQLMREAQLKDRAFHIALIDMKMPRMNGIELIHAVRAHHNMGSTKIAMLTSTSGAGEAAETRAAGADAYLTKPICRADLYSTLTRMAGRARECQFAVAADKKEEIDLRGARVLLAEDNAVNQEIARAMLAAAGCNVTVVGNGKAALQAVQSDPYALVLMDCHMPEMDGFEATMSIRSVESGNSAHVPIIALTANAMAGDRERCLAAGMDDYLSKPFTRSGLVGMLQRWIRPATQETLPNGIKVPDSNGTPVQNDIIPASGRSSEIVEFAPDALRNSLPPNMGLDSPLAHKLIQLYQSEAVGLIARFERAVASGDKQEQLMSTHSLKSSSASMGAIAMAAIAREFEARARTGFSATVGADPTMLRAAFERFCREPRIHRMLQNCHVDHAQA